MKFLSIFFFLLISSNALSAKGRDIYVIKVYHLADGKQERLVDDYLQHAYLPTLHKFNIKHIGVFKPIESTEKLTYVLIPFKSIEMYLQLESKLASDEAYQQLGKEYLNAAHDQPAYTRIETILLTAFDKSPTYHIPALTGPSEKRVYELRSYEGPSERLYKNKVDMFNNGDEVGLFMRLGFNAVFYGEVLAGSKMPNLMYLTTFENRKSRDEHWKKFEQDAYWKKLSSMPAYQHNVSHADITLLYPTTYSDF
ncbi:NIPSNAP family protein [Olivibacter sp. CPCC 100613]|uniref:NIPSNAP family protein n=1 Tax=Olivibacter sp. CPCC 100613 TaxID=3079931 RepID=UPI002FF53BA1